MSNYQIEKDAYGMYYYLNGILHREDGPAIELVNGDRAWWVNGKLHREYDPAIEHGNGTKIWYKNGKLHREAGSAVAFADGYKKWYLNGKFYGENNDFTNESWVIFIETLIIY